MHLIPKSPKKFCHFGTSLSGQWLGSQACNAGGPGFDSGQGTGSRMMQLLCAAVNMNIRLGTAKQTNKNEYERKKDKPKTGVLVFTAFLQSIICKMP